MLAIHRVLGMCRLTVEESQSLVRGAHCARACVLARAPRGGRLYLTLIALTALNRTRSASAAPLAVDEQVDLAAVESAVQAALGHRPMTRSASRTLEAQVQAKGAPHPQPPVAAPAAPVAAAARVPSPPRKRRREFETDADVRCAEVAERLRRSKESGKSLSIEEACKGFVAVSAFYM